MSFPPWFGILTSSPRTYHSFKILSKRNDACEMYKLNSMVRIMKEMAHDLLCNAFEGNKKRIMLSGMNGDSIDGQGRFVCSIVCREHPDGLALMSLSYG